MTSLASSEHHEVANQPSRVRCTERWHVAGACADRATSRHDPPGHPIPRFEVPLRIPRVLEPIRTDATTDYYEIVQREERAEILPGQHTVIWGYNGTFPGPTIKARRGRTTRVRQVNRLGTPTVVHLHGGVTPPESDGFPMDHVMPGEAREYVYPNAQRAATLWYHDHTMDRTGGNIYMGLAVSTCSKTMTSERWVYRRTP
jgi:FtsP/CotA-like multicopper oxidase with cupredoxin domain